MNKCCLDPACSHAVIEAASVEAVKLTDQERKIILEVLKRNEQVQREQQQRIFKSTGTTNLQGTTSLSSPVRLLCPVNDKSETERVVNSKQQPTADRKCAVNIASLILEIVRPIVQCVGSAGGGNASKIEKVLRLRQTLSS
ncbi:hypothetical protein Trydic_g8531 [Trypoxylus dichotomus]